MNYLEYPSLDVAYRAALKVLDKDGWHAGTVLDKLSVGSEFGKMNRPSKELLNFSFKITKPQDRLLFSKSRPINLSFALANCIWTLAGRDDLDFINYYNPRGTYFSDDNVSLHGAHGKRIINSDNINQLNAAIKRLREDPNSRRVVLNIYQPIDTVSRSRDIPCVIAIQFMQRAERLHSIVYMRSQSAAMVLPYDVFVFTFLQEAVAIELKLKVGNYFHTSGSFHYYLDEKKTVDSVLKEKPSNFGVPTHMPNSVSPFDMIRKIIGIEDRLRKSSNPQDELDQIREDYFEPYWKEVLYILAIKIFQKKNLDPSSLYQSLPDYYLSHYRLIEGVQ